MAGILLLDVSVGIATDRPPILDDGVERLGVPGKDSVEPGEIKVALLESTVVQFHHIFRNKPTRTAEEKDEKMA